MEVVYSFLSGVIKALTDWKKELVVHHTCLSISLPPRYSSLTCLFPFCCCCTIYL